MGVDPVDYSAIKDDKLVVDAFDKLPDAVEILAGRDQDLLSGRGDTPGLRDQTGHAGGRRFLLTRRPMPVL